MRLFQRLREDSTKDWSAYVGHAFVRAMADGSLPEACFRHYLVQDYLFLVQFARAHALGIYKAGSPALMREILGGLKAVLEIEMELHLRLCAGWGLTAEQVESSPEAMATVAYTRFVLDAGQAGDLLDLYVALSPCMIGYAEIALSIRDGATPGNPYRPWIEEYASDGYQAAAQATGSLLDRLADVALTESRYPALRDRFARATRLEAAFWQMGLDQAA